MNNKVILVSVIAFVAAIVAYLFMLNSKKEKFRSEYRSTKNWILNGKKILELREKEGKTDREEKYLERHGDIDTEWVELMIAKAYEENLTFEKIMQRELLYIIAPKFGYSVEQAAANL